MMPREEQVIDLRTSDARLSHTHLIKFWTYIGPESRKSPTTYEISWLEGRATYTRPAAGHPRARRVAAAHYLYTFLAIPVMLVYGLFVPLWTGVLGRDKVPWIMSKALTFYNWTIGAVLYRAVFWLSGEPGF